MKFHLSGSVLNSKGGGGGTLEYVNVDEGRMKAKAF